MMERKVDESNKGRIEKVVNQSRIIAAIASGKDTLNKISYEVGISKRNTSTHLKRLEEMKFIEATFEGKAYPVEERKGIHNTYKLHYEVSTCPEIAARIFDYVSKVRDYPEITKGRDLVKELMLSKWYFKVYFSVISLIPEIKSEYGEEFDNNGLIKMHDVDIDTLIDGISSFENSHREEGIVTTINRTDSKEMVSLIMNSRAFIYAMKQLIQHFPSAALRAFSLILGIKGDDREGEQGKPVKFYEVEDKIFKGPVELYRYLLSEIIIEAKAEDSIASPLFILSSLLKSGTFYSID